MIELKNVSAGYEGRPVISHIDLSIAEGQVTTILGKNGCGKTTLLRTIARQVRASSGEILLDEKSLYGLDSKALARRLSYLPQAKAAVPISVQTLVLHGRFPHRAFPRSLSASDLQIAEQAMRETGVWAQRHRTVSELSGGERQKAYLAMALAQDADIILLDEPTAYLDINHQLEIFQIVKRLQRLGKTIVMVLHDLPAALQHSDRICLMMDGRIVSHDTVSGVLASRQIDRVFQVRLEQGNLPDGQPGYFVLSNTAPE